MQHTFWNPSTGMNPAEYEAFRARCNPDQRDCCYPALIGSRILMSAPVKAQRFGAVIWAYDQTGFAWRSLNDETVTGWFFWKDECGIDPSEGSLGTWDWIS